MITDQKKYFNWLKDDLIYLTRWKKIEIFLFGGSIKRDNFWDIDIWIQWEVEERDEIAIKWYFEEATFPFYIDLVNFNKVEKNFKENVLNNWVIWIKH